MYYIYVFVQKCFSDEHKLLVCECACVGVSKALGYVCMTELKYPQIMFPSTDSLIKFLLYSVIYVGFNFHFTYHCNVYNYNSTH